MSKEGALEKVKECAGGAETQGRPGPSRTDSPVIVQTERALNTRRHGASLVCKLQVPRTESSVLSTCLVQIEGSMRGAGVTVIHRGTESWPPPHRALPFVPGQRSCGSTVLGPALAGPPPLNAAVEWFAQDRESVGLSLPRYNMISHPMTCGNRPCGGHEPSKIQQIRISS